MTLFAVLDIDQTMYRFAGGKPEIMTSEIEKYYPDIQTHKLSTNYRSTKTIVETQLKLVAHNYSDLGGPYEQKYMKELRAREDAPGGSLPVYTEYDSPESEAEALTASLIEALANGRKPGDFFVGARTRAQLGYLEGPLVRAKIPFINIAGGSFWASKHVADIVGYLRLAYNPDDNEAFKRVFNIASNYMTYPWGDKQGQYCPHRYLGNAFLQACGESFRNVWEAADVKNSFRPGVQDLVNFVEDVQTHKVPAEAIEFIAKDCYIKYLQAEEGLVEGDEAENGKLEDLATVAETARQFKTVAEFLDHVAEAVKVAEAAKEKAWDDHVVISTVHRLKGLERPVIFGIGLSEGLLPHSSALSEPIRRSTLPTGEQGRLEDELCICFVLVSRAKEEIHLSSVKTYRKKQQMGPSRFIEMMSLNDREGAQHETGAQRHSSAYPESPDETSS